MTQKQREKIKELKEKIKFLKKKYKTEELPMKQKRRDGRNVLNKYCCMVCNRRYEWSFVCSSCVSKDLLEFQKKLDWLENQIAPRSNSPSASAKAEDLICVKEEFQK